MHGVEICIVPLATVSSSRARINLPTNLYLDPVFAQFNVSSPSLCMSFVWFGCFVFYLTAHFGFIFPCCCLNALFYKRVCCWVRFP